MPVTRRQTKNGKLLLAPELSLHLLEPQTYFSILITAYFRFEIKQKQVSKLN